MKIKAQYTEMCGVSQRNVQEYILVGKNEYLKSMIQSFYKRNLKEKKTGNKSRAIKINKKTGTRDMEHRYTIERNQ